MDIKTLEKTASEVRIGVVRAIHNAGSGHPGGSLSAADIVTALYFDEMNIDPEHPDMDGERQIHPVERTCRPCTVFGSCSERILRHGGIHDTEKAGIEIPGAS